MSTIFCRLTGTSQRTNQLLGHTHAQLCAWPAQCVLLSGGRSQRRPQQLLCEHSVSGLNSRSITALLRSTLLRLPARGTLMDGARTAALPRERTGAPERSAARGHTSHLSGGGGSSLGKQRLLQDCMPNVTCLIHVYV